MKAKKQLNFFDKLLLWINFCLCIALLISYLAPITNPSKYWIVAFFGLAYPFLLLGNVLLIIYWLMRKTTWVLLPIIVIALGWNILNKNVGLRFSSETDSKPENNLRIMT